MNIFAAYALTGLGVGLCAMIFLGPKWVSPLGALLLVVLWPLLLASVVFLVACDWRRVNR